MGAENLPFIIIYNIHNRTFGNTVSTIKILWY